MAAGDVGDRAEAGVVTGRVKRLRYLVCDDRPEGHEFTDDDLLIAARGYADEWIDRLYAQVSGLQSVMAARMAAPKLCRRS